MLHFQNLDSCRYMGDNYTDVVHIYIYIYVCIPSNYCVIKITACFICKIPEGKNFSSSQKKICFLAPTVYT